MAIAASGKDILAVFFDDGAYQTLGCGANGVTCAFGSAQGVPVYAVCQSGAAMTADGARAFAKTLELAAVTGNPVVTFYQSAGAKLEEGQQILRSGAQLAAAVAKISGVVPQIAVVTGALVGLNHAGAVHGVHVAHFILLLIHLHDISCGWQCRP